MAKDLEARISDLEKRVSVLEKGTHGISPESGGKKRTQSVSEFLREKQVTRATSAANLVLAIAVYCENFRGADAFSVVDLRDLIREAKHKQPANINDCIYRNIPKGYIAEDERGEDGKKRWYVTNSGIELVDNNFNQDEQNN
ncbi:MAG: hypothetical protein OXN17_03095 [Candidatus Poribacteria bacterium]|nr:hypothetical protein [Candidatus Poribacteria bacterium]MDE0504201.1 hypothetical protein [Candidatus Poribacteria bacterium]